VTERQKKDADEGKDVFDSALTPLVVSGLGGAAIAAIAATKGRALRQLLRNSLPVLEREAREGATEFERRRAAWRRYGNEQTLKGETSLRNDRAAAGAAAGAAGGYWVGEGARRRKKK
jgi:hypothetical protein